MPTIDIVVKQPKERIMVPLGSDLVDIADHFKDNFEGRWTWIKPELIRWSKPTGYLTNLLHNDYKATVTIDTEAASEHLAKMMYNTLFIREGSFQALMSIPGSDDGSITAYTASVMISYDRFTIKMEQEDQAKIEEHLKKVHKKNWAINHVLY
ncbi:hypothetical protein H6504_04925 [Candidatus Woesearchaeota archaeon]|nr:hypothetical protein [Candidatus Woesearchaeota archaeon]